MYLKKLTIKTPKEIIREMDFKAGLNLIIDDTDDVSSKTTGNNVGKTTVLKLIDFCLGADAKIIYTDTENKKNIYKEVKDYLTEKQVIIELELIEDITNQNSKTVIITRNFLSRKKAIRQINGKDILDKDFHTELEKHIFPSINVKKPSFREIISHNIRYKDDSINKTLKTLDKFTNNVEYETLYLFLLGLERDDADKKQALTTKISQEVKFKERLEKSQNKTTYELLLKMIEDEIEKLNDKKNTFNLNDSLENDLEELNNVKYSINKLSSQISKMEIRKSLINEAKSELENNVSTIDTNQLKILYKEVTLNIDSVQKTFEDLLNYHNKMIVEKIKFISHDLPELESKLQGAKTQLNELLNEEKRLSKKISKGDTFEELEKVIEQLNEKYRIKGEYESAINQITEVEKNINDLNNKITKIDNILFSNEFENKLKEQLTKFNKYFSEVSQELYDESYALTYKVLKNKSTGKPTYEFNSFNANMSSGKKQGEILCFDLAYLLFAEKENIPSLKFLLNDKKELMHDHQLIKVAEYVRDKNIQLVISILKDKLLEEALDTAHVVIKLSQNDRLFRIEKNTL
ncbi:DUF2326 domain-containing protein [Holdemanella biformis]|uniref:DUF2326 domain-containing protein n=1 Tax=Holdemanella biformis TaxID=1735 RepID=UPI003078EDA7